MLYIQIMQKIIIYSRSVTAIFILLFIISASGFTFHFHHCLMGNDNNQVCCEMAAQIEVTQQDQPRSSDTPVIDETSDPCCTTITAGGMNTAPSIHEIPQKPVNIEKMLFSFPASESILITANFKSTTHVSPTYNVFLLSGEKCALTSVLLI